MSGLPPDIILIIFNYIKKITDKRQFLRTCKLCNYLTKDLIKIAEKKFFDNFVSNERNIKTLCYCPNTKINKIKKDKLIKFTLEICSDEYFHLLPLSYLNSNNNQIVGFLVDYNKFELLQIAFKNGCNISKVCWIAMSNGYLEMFKWAIKNNYKWDGSKFGIAAQNNHVDIIEYVIKYVKKYDWTLEEYDSICAHATLSGNLDLVKLLVRHGFTLSTKTCAWAAKSGHLHILKWLRKYNCPWDSETCSMAALNGHLDILKWARENSCPFNVTTCSNAAKKGHLHILKWARENGFPWNMNTCNMAAKGGYLHILEWAMANGCEWDIQQICIKAATRGNLYILKWAIGNGHTFDYNICEQATINSSYDVVRWVIENGYEISDKTCYYIACDVNQVGLLKLALNKGGIWNDRFTSLICAKNNYDYGDYFNTLNDYRTISGELKILKWAKKHGYPI